MHKKSIDDSRNPCYHLGMLRNLTLDIRKFPTFHSIQTICWTHFLSINHHGSVKNPSSCRFLLGRFPLDIGRFIRVNSRVLTTDFLDRSYWTRFLTIPPINPWFSMLREESCTLKAHFFWKLPLGFLNIRLFNQKKRSLENAKYPADKLTSIYILYWKFIHMEKNPRLYESIRYIPHGAFICRLWLMPRCEASKLHHTWYLNDTEIPSGKKKTSDSETLKPECLFHHGMNSWKSIYIIYRNFEILLLHIIIIMLPTMTVFFSGGHCCQIGFNVRWMSFCLSWLSLHDAG